MGISKKLPSDSSASSIPQSLFPNFAEFPFEFKTPPLIIVGSIFVFENIEDINETLEAFSKIRSKLKDGTYQKIAQKIAVTS